MTTYAISIGHLSRSGAKQLPETETAFRASVTALAARHGEVYAVTTGAGKYLGEYEPCSVILADAANPHDLEPALSRLAAQYDQDTVGLLVADAPTLIPAHTEDTATCTND